MAWKRILALVLVAAAGVGLFAWHKLAREEPQQFASMDERFKYGSIGTEGPEGMPYWIWLVLPRVFSKHLPGPGGYASLGLVWEEGQEIPVGFSKKIIGFPRIGINCALCHCGTYRTEPAQAPRVVAGAPATRIDVLGYQRFLFNCADDPRFNADTLLEAMEYNVKLSESDKLLYRQVIIPLTKNTLLKTKQRFAWTQPRPAWGRGRIDPFNPVKFHQLGMDPVPDWSIGNSNMEPIWNIAPRANSPLHWDGLNHSLTEVVLSSAIGDGATPDSLPVKELAQLQDWIMQLQPPPFPFKVNLNLALTKGKPIYDRLCADCHAPGGKRAGKVIPLEEIKTDRHRIEMWTQHGQSPAAEIYNQKYAKYPWGFSHFTKTTSYVAVPLDGLWLRAPYLHNGSVPTLADLLKPRPSRPRTFYRGFDLYDPRRVGFVHEAKLILDQDPTLQQSMEPRKLLDQLYFLYDTTVAGNSNEGHEGRDYGTELSDTDREALLEYLKTL